MSENTDKENIDTNKGKRDLGKISYSPFNMLDKTVDFPVEEDIKLFTKPYDDIARARRVRAKDLMGVKLYDELSRENSMLARTSKNRFDPLISQKIDQKLNEARLKVQKDMDERKEREKQHYLNSKELFERKKTHEELDKQWLAPNPEMLDETLTPEGFILVDTPRPEPLTPKSNTPSGLRKTKSISNLGSFFNLGGKKSQNKNTRQNCFKKQSKKKVKNIKKN
jgi:hypothetical protein